MINRAIISNYYDNDMTDTLQLYDNFYPLTTEVCSLNSLIY